MPEGSTVAMSDPDEAMRLCTARLAELEEVKRANPEGIADDPLARIAAFAGYHLDPRTQ